MKNYLTKPLNPTRTKNDRGTFLKTQDAKNDTTHIQSQNIQRKCPTCKRISMETSDVNKHRAHRPKCQQQWQEEKPYKNTCTQQGCNKTIHRTHQLQKHMEQHQEQPDKLDLYNHDPLGELTEEK